VSLEKEVNRPECGTARNFIQATKDRTENKKRKSKASAMIAIYVAKGTAQGVSFADEDLPIGLSHELRH